MAKKRGALGQRPSLCSISLPASHCRARSWWGAASSRLTPPRDPAGCPRSWAWPSSPKWRPLGSTPSASRSGRSWIGVPPPTGLAVEDALQVRPRREPAAQPWPERAIVGERVARRPMAGGGADPESRGCTTLPGRDASSHVASRERRGRPPERSDLALISQCQAVHMFILKKAQLYVRLSNAETIW